MRNINYKSNDYILYRLHKTRLAREKFEGIPVCDEWKGEHGFENFKNWCLENGWKKGLQIDRKNTFLGYSPENCRIVTLKENCRNRKDTVFVEYNGETRKLVELSEECGIRYSVLYSRVKAGWDLERALTTPEKTIVHRKGGARFGNRKERQPLPTAIPYEKAIGEVIKKY